MKKLIRTFIVFAIVNLLTAGFAPAQDEQTEAARMEAETDRAEIEVREAQEKVDAERDQIEELKARIKELQQRARGSGLVLPTPTPPVSEIGFPPSNWGMQSGGGSSILVIPSAQMSTEDILAINEDMTVMSRILRKQIDQEAKSNWMYGSSWNFNFNHLMGHRSNTAEVMYLEGYGALFLIKVDFPLSPPAEEAEEENETEQEDADPVWQQTRRDIYEPQQVRAPGRGTQDTEKEYDAEKVENLKANLIEALKHATNIRGLKPGESVILTITGSYEPSDLTNIVITTKVKDGKENTQIIGTPTSSEAGFSSPTMLVIRAKKSDIDGFANDDINLEQFRERVQILACPYLGEGTSQRSTAVISGVRSTGRNTGGRSSARSRRGEQR